MKIVITIFYIIMCATFLQCSNDDLFAAGKRSEESSRSTSPASRPVSPEELAPPPRSQPNLLLQAIIKNPKKNIIKLQDQKAHGNGMLAKACHEFYFMEQERQFCYKLQTIFLVVFPLFQHILQP